MDLKNKVLSASKVALGGVIAGLIFVGINYIHYAQNVRGNTWMNEECRNLGNLTSFYFKNFDIKTDRFEMINNYIEKCHLNSEK